MLPYCSAAANVITSRKLYGRKKWAAHKTNSRTHNFVSEETRICISLSIFQQQINNIPSELYLRAPCASFSLSISLMRPVRVPANAAVILSVAFRVKYKLFVVHLVSSVLRYLASAHPIERKIKLTICLVSCVWQTRQNEKFLCWNRWSSHSNHSHRDTVFLSFQAIHFNVCFCAERQTELAVEIETQPGRRSFLRETRVAHENNYMTRNILQHGYAIRVRRTHSNFPANDEKSICAKIKRRKNEPAKH